MTTGFPTSLDSLTNPTGASSLTSPDHAGQHADANDAIEALQAKVGVNGSAVVTSLDYKVGLLSAVGASSLTGTIASFNQERNASVTVGQKYANGNGSADSYISFPSACKLVAATIAASTDINGTAVIRPFLNTAVLAVATYDMTVSVASPISSYDFFPSPLSIPANQRFAWNCQSSTLTVGTTSITFYVKFD